ncbi:MAG: hypothetical protein JW994_05970 [Candidatus Omnitrophica bacterium]|nr:hypothetical protein [Candidatus Omnitrophota bacterium]
MNWQFKKEFYGRKEGLNLKCIKEYLEYGYYHIPLTMFSGYYRAVYVTGDYDSIYSRIEKPFPDALTVQRPKGKFAMHFSGGFDSSLVAKFYDGDDVDYIHLVGPESDKARAFAKTLKGKLHEIEITPEEFIKVCNEVLPLFREPYPYNDIVFAYIASKKAKELGHSLIITGDGGDVVFGGLNVGPDSAEACDIWKTLEPNFLLGMDTLQPLMHSVLLNWSKAELLPKGNISVNKPFLRDYFRELNMPREIAEQKKVPWGGSTGVLKSEYVVTYLKDTVQSSSHNWITKFKFYGEPKHELLFRQYSLVKWLERNYKEKIGKSEQEIFLKEIGNVDEHDRRERKERHMREIKNGIKVLSPAPALQAIRKFKKLKVR